MVLLFTRFWKLESPGLEIHLHRSSDPICLRSSGKSDESIIPFSLAESTSAIGGNIGRLTISPEPWNAIQLLGGSAICSSSSLVWWYAKPEISQVEQPISLLSRAQTQQKSQDQGLEQMWRMQGGLINLMPCCTSNCLICSSICELQFSQSKTWGKL